MNTFLVFLCLLAGVILVSKIRRAALRRKRAETHIMTIDLGNTVADMRLKKKEYQLQLKELRIQNSEAAAMGQAVRAVHRSKHVRGRHGPGFVGSLLSLSNTQVAIEADRGLMAVTKQRVSLREQIVLVERIINGIDAKILEVERETTVSKKKRRS